MIFPPIRISQLSHDLEVKRAAFQESKIELTQAVKHKISPLNILREHPQLWVGAAMSVLGAGGLGKFVTMFAGGRNGNGGNGNGHKSKSSLLGGLLRFGGRTAMKTVAPVAMNAVKFALKSAFRSFRARRDHRQQPES
jgi:hypothetical protein